MKTCQICGAQNPEDSVFCTECGERLEENIKRVMKPEGVISTGNLSTKRCPYCGEEIKTDALKCKHCSEWLNKSSKPKIEVQNSNAQPIGRLLPLIALTFGLYIFYWYYRNWKHLKNHKNIDISPGARTVLLIIPIVGYFMLYEQFSEIKKYAKERGCKTYSSGLLVLAYFVISVFLVWMPFVGALFIWPVIVVQETLNEYWRVEQPNLPIKKSFTDGELLVIIISGIIILLVIILYFLAVPR